MRRPDRQSGNQAQLHYAAVGENWRKEQKYGQLSAWSDFQSVKWRRLMPDAKSTWLTDKHDTDFAMHVPLGIKHSSSKVAAGAVFSLFSLGVTSNRDAYAYNVNHAILVEAVKGEIAAYSDALGSYKDLKPPRPRPDEVVDSEDPRIKWTRQVKASLGALKRTHYNQEFLRTGLYRPFFKLAHYFDDFWNEERYQTPHFFPLADSVNEVICVPPIGARTPPWAFAANLTPNLNLMSIDAAQCFAFYIYDEDGTNRRENITDWALAEFRSHYGQSSISKWDIFHYIYALLHHPEYRTRYAANLKRELPRVPFAPDFGRYAEIGKKLMDLHIHYEQQPEYPLERTEIGKLNWRVEKMRLSKDKTKLVYNNFLTLCGIPQEVYEYRLGNRSALEWIVDQYQVSKDNRSGIVNDPNRDDDPEYIVRLIGQVVTVSIETVKLVRELAALPLLAG